MYMCVLVLPSAMAHMTGVGLSDGNNKLAANGTHEQSTPTERTRLVKITSSPDCEDVSSHFAVEKYPVRWFVLVVFSLNLAVSCTVWFTINPIADTVACYYGVSLWWINALSWVYMLTYVLLFIPGARFLDALGLRAAIIVSACCSAAGTWLRFAGAGELVAAIYQCPLQ